MGEKIFSIFPELRERLGRIYNCDEGYLQSIEQENVAEGMLKEVLEPDQLALVNKYLDIAAATSDIAAAIAYRQGMRDLIQILTDK